MHTAVRCLLILAGCMAVFAIMSATPALAFAGPRAKATKPAARASKAPKKKKNAAAKRTAPTVTVAPAAASAGTVTRMPISTPTDNPAETVASANASGGANAMNADAKSTNAKNADAMNADAKSTNASANGNTGSPWRTAGFVGLGVGALAVGTGAVLAVMSANERSDLAERCPNDVCAETDRAAWERGRSQANTATFALAAGGVLVGASVALVVFGGPKKEDSRVELRASPSSITLAGRFQ